MAHDDLQLLVGETTPERDIMEYADDLVYSSAEPGGFAACSFAIPGGALPRTINGLRRRNRIWVKRGTKTCWQGRIINDPQGQAPFGGASEVKVEAAGMLNDAKAREDYCRTYRDKDFGQFTVYKLTHATYECDNDGHLYWLVPSGLSLPGAQSRNWEYWIDGGLASPARDIACIYLDYNYDRGTAFDGSVSTGPDHPRVTAWTVDSSFLLSTGGTSPQTAKRIPASGLFPTGTRSLRLRFYNGASTTTTADRFWEVTRAVVYGTLNAGVSMGGVTGALEDAALDLTSSLRTASITGPADPEIVARPFTSRAAYMESVAQLAEDPLLWGFWEDDVFVARERDTTPRVPDHLVVRATDAGVTWEVERNYEDGYDGVTVYYQYAGSTYPDGTLVAYTSPSSGLSATSRVLVLDYSDRILDSDELTSIITQARVIRGVAMYQGSVEVQGSCRLVNGAVIAATDIRAGMWAENLDEPGHGPRFINHVEYTRANDTARCTVGNARKDFSTVVPIPKSTSPITIVKKS